jgi:hypothetical protein
MGLHGVDGVDEEVGDDLADFAVEAEDGALGAFALFDGDVGVDDAAAEDVERGEDEIVAGDLGGAGGLTVEAEGLAGDGGGAAKFRVSEREVFAALLEVVGAAREVEKVVTDSSGLLISCAMEEARRPTAASFSVRRRACSASLRSVMSRTTPVKRRGVPSAVRWQLPRAETQWMVVGVVWTR